MRCLKYLTVNVDNIDDIYSQFNSLQSLTIKRYNNNYSNDFEKIFITSFEKIVESFK